MYAIDSDHGHIARRLLEAGARPDLAGLDGVLPVGTSVNSFHSFCITHNAIFSSKNSIFT